MTKRLQLFLSIAVGFAVLFTSGRAIAATLFLSPPGIETNVGEKIIFDLKIDSEGVGLNAAQATIRFPKDILEAVSIDKTGSAFSFWLEEPNFSNTDGIISFTGGTPYGVSGSAIQTLKIAFQTKGIGISTLSITDAAITASDGSGTNILSKVNEASFNISPEKATPPLPLPQEILRKAVPATALPAKPAIKVPLYPDPTRWHNSVSPFVVSWDLPPDIVGVSTALNKHPNFISAANSEGLFDNKTLNALQDGVWYLHIRFQNNIGWGPASHYRLAIDTQPPLGFEILAVEGESTDNPAPTFNFATQDALSGLKEYQIRIGDGDLIKIPAGEFDGSFKLPLQAPGARQLAVKALDQAENGLENSIKLDILPIAAPTITFITKELFSDEEKGLTLKGAALPKVKVLLGLHRQGTLVARGVSVADENGRWEFVFDQSLKNGVYKVGVQSQDARGALSLVVESSEIRIKSKPIVQIGVLQLGKTGVIIFLLIILTIGFCGGAWFYKKRREKLALRVGFTEAEVSKIFRLIREDVEKLAKAEETPTSADEEYAAKRLQENIQKMEAYLKKGLEKITR